jgi:hypothetical protein
MVLVSKAVAISGAGDGHDDDGEVTSIHAGTIPFYVAAPGAHVSIQGLRFILPKKAAVVVYAVSGLVIASCKIEGAVPVDHGSAGIDIGTSFNPPTPMNPGKPENVSGTVFIVNNVIDVAGGTALDHALGVIMFSVGVPGAEVEAYISGNTIRNATERSINIYRVVGRAYVEGNVITTSTIVGNSGALDVIHVFGLGSYLIARNRVHCRWASGAGIRVHSNQLVWPITQANVVDNDVTMDGTMFDTQSAGINIRGNAQGTVVLNNRIRGRARAALVVDLQGSAAPANNAFVLNRLDDFEVSLADVFVDDGVMNTLIAGQGTVVDQGVGTDIVALPSRAVEKNYR